MIDYELRLKQLEEQINALSFAFREHGLTELQIRKRLEQRMSNLEMTLDKHREHMRIWYKEKFDDHAARMYQLEKNIDCQPMIYNALEQRIARLEQRHDLGICRKVNPDEYKRHPSCIEGYILMLINEANLYCLSKKELLNLVEAHLNKDE